MSGGATRVEAMSASNGHSPHTTITQRPEGSVPITIERGEYQLHGYGLPESWARHELLAAVAQAPKIAAEDYVGLAVCALDVARGAADAIAAKREELGEVRAYSQSKSSPVDPVTVVDTLAEEFITARLHELRPHDGFIGEEGTSEASLSGVTWIADPIDGTVNFIYGLPQYAVSLAAAIDGHVVAGCVINVRTQEVYLAARGQGSWLLERNAEPRRLSCSEETRISLALMATGFAYSSARREEQAKILGEVLPAFRDIRRMGSAALDLCALARGWVDAYYEHGLNSWDYAAGILIAEEAGAKIFAPELSTTTDSGRILWGCAGPLHEEFSQFMAGIPTALPR